MLKDVEAILIFQEESQEQLADLERDLLVVEQGGEDRDQELVDKIFRAMHTIKGGAGFLGYGKIKELSHRMENIVGLIRDNQLIPDSGVVSVLLKVADTLGEMIHDLEQSDTVDLSEHLNLLEKLVDGNKMPERAGEQREKKPDPVEKTVEPPPSVHPVHTKKTQARSTEKTVTKLEQQAASRDPFSADTSLRVSLKLLNRLMNLAGELVLSRNQLVQAVGSRNMESIEHVKQRIDVITTELQESIMFTRMQPIGAVFKKFPRLARELTRHMGKEVELELEGENVELDKTILEAINAPLTHLVRNAIDHGIETPPERQAAHKDKTGKVTLKAAHEAGMVIIEVGDDGRGMDPEKIAVAAVNKRILTEEQVQCFSDMEKLHLIFLPGFSTAEAVTDVSGRGVGMDVVKTNLDKLGGQVEILSKPGSGTSIRIKLPLTLAIISAQIVVCGSERYSIPQVNLDELLRVPAVEIKERVEVIGKAAVLKLRSKLLPLVRLSDVLGRKQEYLDPESGRNREDRRKNIADRRSPHSAFFFTAEQGREDAQPQDRPEIMRARRDRRRRISGALHIAIVNTGRLKYGLVVDALRDVEEIVVKPLGRHLKSCRKYSGATIMGDGSISMILDVTNIAEEAGLISFENSDRAIQLRLEQETSEGKLHEKQSFLLFRSGGSQQFGVPLNIVQRVIRVDRSDMEEVSGRKTLRYQDRSLPLFSIDEVVPTAGTLGDSERLQVIIFFIAGREIGLMATRPVNSVEMVPAIDDKTHQEPGIMGSVIMGPKTILVVNIYEMIKILKPNWFASETPLTQERGKYTILIAEDSAFFRNQITRILREEGFRTMVAEDGRDAWEQLREHGRAVSMLVTDIEMPRMNGFQLAEKIRDDERFVNLPIVAVTTLSGAKNFQKGIKAGVDRYLVKFDREQLVGTVLAMLEIE